MFIYTTATVIRTLLNTKHCSRNFKNYCVQISLFLYIHFFGLGPDAAETQYLTHTNQFHFHSVIGHSPDSSPLHYKPCCLWAQELVADEHLNPSLSSHCLAVAWLPCHPLDVSCIAVRMTPSPFPVSLWGGSLAIHSLPHHGKTSSPSAVALWHGSFAICWTPAVSLYYRPISARRTPEGRTLWVDSCYPLDIGLYSVVSLLKCSALFQTTLSVSFSRMYEKALVVLYTGMFCRFPIWNHCSGLSL